MSICETVDHLLEPAVTNQQSYTERRCSYFVRADDNLCHIGIGDVNDEFSSGTFITLILPHLRGVSEILVSRYEGHEFYVMTHDSANPIGIRSGGSYNEVLDAKLKQTLVQVRHELLAVINAYYHRPYCGEQLKLFKD